MKFTIEPYGVAAKLITDPRKWPVKADAEDCVGVVCRYNNVMCIGVFDGQLATLAHELFHVVMFVFKYAGINPMEAGGEPGAYLLDNLFSKCADAVVKSRQ